MRIPPALLLLALGFSPGAAAAVSGLRTAPGWSVEVFQEGVSGARSLARGDQGTLFIGTRGDRVFALRQGKIFVLARGLNQPNGVAFHKGDLYVAEISRILRFPSIESRLESPPAPQVLDDRLPKEGAHGWKYLRFSPEGELHFAIGAPCNVCERPDPFAAILRYRRLDGAAPEVIARGVRNSVGFDFHPKTGKLWFTDNGRDWLGDDLPPDELNVLEKPGAHFGFPWCHGGLADPEFQKRKCPEFTPPAWKFEAHTAPLGMRFLDDRTLLVAQHGSWNRSRKIGYRVVEMTLENGAPKKANPVLEFLGENEKVSGRPVDVLPLSTREILVSDDDQGRILRLFRSK